MKKIVISPYSRALRNGKNNPKNYPWWGEVVALLKEQGCKVIQVGTKGEGPIPGVDDVLLNLPLKELKELLEECDTWASVDNFFQHFAYLHGKPGVVIFGQGNPLIFGHPQNKNLLKDPKYLREKQFDIWEAIAFNQDAFVDPATVVKALLS
jgi:ADP-heptose:LPS heptosyltransferase